MSGVHVRVQMLNTDVPCAKYSELLEKVYDSDWVQKEEQRNKVSNIRSSHVETDLIWSATRIGPWTDPLSSLHRRPAQAGRELPSTSTPLC